MPDTVSTHEDAQQTGYLGTVADQIPNEDYAVDADHEATAKAQREQLLEQRKAALEVPAEPKATKSTAKSSGSSSSGSSSGSS